MRRCQQHDSKSKDGTRGYTQTDSSTTQQGQREHYAGVDGCSRADGQRQDSIPASQSHSQQTAESSNRKLESHISDQQRGDTVQINNPDTLPDSQMLNSQDQLHLNVPGKHKLNSQVTIENTAGHTDIDNMWEPTDQKLDLNVDKCWETCVFYVVLSLLFLYVSCMFVLFPSPLSTYSIIFSFLSRNDLNDLCLHLHHFLNNSAMFLLIICDSGQK